jgi:hypothetical protein
MSASIEIDVGTTHDVPPESSQSGQTLEEWTRHTKSLYEKYVYPMKFQIDGKEFTIVQENVICSEDLGNTVWDGSLVLVHYFSNKKVFSPDYWKGKRCIELGSGTGIVGIVVSTFGANIILTDKEPQIDLIKASIEKNKTLLMDSNISVQRLLWGEPLEDSESLLPLPFDAIIASECIYYEELVVPLCKSLDALSGPETDIYISYESHNPDGVAFFLKIAQKIFEITEIPASSLDPIYQSKRINVLLLKKKKFKPDDQDAFAVTTHSFV